MKRFIPASLRARVIVLLLGGLTAFHVFSLWIYQNGLDSFIGSTREERLTDRMVIIRRTLIGLSPAARDAAAHALSGAGFDVHWTPQSLVTQATAAVEELSRLRARLRASLPDVDDARIRVGYLDEGVGLPNEPLKLAEHVLIVSVKLPDDTWVNVAAPQVRPIAFSERSVLYSITAMGIGIVLLSVVIARPLTAPLQTLARAAQRIGTSGRTSPVPESGPREVRIAAHAFNQMQARIQKLMDERAQTLAAVSHDLRTPITRLRFRAEFTADPETKQKMTGDLDEMERMLDATLTFLRDDIGRDEPKVADLAAILQTICNDEADAGRTVVYDGPDQAALLCRGSALKRAFANIVGNAVKYGGDAKVTLRADARALTVTVEDHGPGIPESEMDRVFEPFQRIEGSRNVDTGGYGLGLTSARSIIRSHGGEISLVNRREGGLSVTTTLPKSGLGADLRG